MKFQYAPYLLPKPNAPVVIGSGQMLLSSPGKNLSGLNLNGSGYASSSCRIALRGVSPSFLQPGEYLTMRLVL